MIRKGKWSRKFPEPAEQKFWNDCVSSTVQTFVMVCVTGLASCVVFFAFGVAFQGISNISPAAFVVLATNSLLFSVGIWLRKKPMLLENLGAFSLFGMSFLFLSMLGLVQYGNADGRYVGNIVASILMLSVPFAPAAFWPKVACVGMFVLTFGVVKFMEGEPLRQIVVYCISYFAVLVAISFAHDEAMRRNYSLKEEVQSQSKKLESILRKIYPEPVFAKVQHMETPTFVQKYESVSVMFVDIVGFAAFAQSREPEEVVRVLDELFSRIDASCKKSGALKIKTIGDAYLAVTGIDGEARHQAIMADLALEVREAVKKYAYLQDLDLEVRIGIHAGPVVGGIIGRETSHFDLWGDTVNIASRLESHGVPGKIQVSEAFANQISESFRMAERGEIQLKGVGEFRCFFLEGPKSQVGHKSMLNAA